MVLFCCPLLFRYSQVLHRHTLILLYVLAERTKLNNSQYVYWEGLAISGILVIRDLDNLKITVGGFVGNDGNEGPTVISSQLNPIPKSTWHIFVTIKRNKNVTKPNVRPCVNCYFLWLWFAACTQYARTHTRVAKYFCRQKNNSVSV